MEHPWPNPGRPTRNKNAMPSQGRKLELEFVMDEFVRLVRQGLYLDTVCRITLISRTSMYRWFSYGRLAEEQCEIDKWGDRVYPDGVKFKPIYAEFLDAVENASAEAEADALRAVLDAGDVKNAQTGIPNWQAKAWFLERRFPHKYGQRVQVTDGDDMVRSNDDVMTPDQLTKIAQSTLDQAATMKKLAALAVAEVAE